MDPVWIEQAPDLQTTLITDANSRVAALVNPGSCDANCLSKVQTLGRELRYVFVGDRGRSPAAEDLAFRCGAKIYAFHPHLPVTADEPGNRSCSWPLRDGDVIEFGNVRLKIAAAHDRRALMLQVFDLTHSDRFPQCTIMGETAESLRDAMQMDYGTTCERSSLL